MRQATRLTATVLAALLLACTGSAPAAQSAPPPQDDRSRCAAMCEHIQACEPPAAFVGVAACTSACTEDPRQRAGPCRAPRLAYEACITELPCADVRTERASPLAAPGPCAASRKGLLECEPDPPAPHIEFQF